MAYQTKEPVIYEPDGDLTRDAIRKFMHEFDRVYEILNKVRALLKPLEEELTDGDIWYDDSQKKLMRLENGCAVPLIRIAATEAEITGGDDNDLFMTPKTVREAVLDILINLTAARATTEQYGTVKISAERNTEGVATTNRAYSIAEEVANSVVNSNAVKSARFDGGVTPGTIVKSGTALLFPKLTQWANAAPVDGGGGAPQQNETAYLYSYNAGGLIGSGKVFAKNPDAQTLPGIGSGSVSVTKQEGVYLIAMTGIVTGVSLTGGGENSYSASVSKTALGYRIE